MQKFTVVVCLWISSALLCFSNSQVLKKPQTTYRSKTEVLIWKRNHSADNIDLRCCILSSLSKIGSVIDCGRRCGNYFSCQSFSYYGDGGKCRLHYRRMTKFPDDSTSPGWQYFYFHEGSCPTESGFVYLKDGNICVRIFDDTKTWHEARDFCRSFGSRLIVLDTEEKNLALWEHMKKNCYEYNSMYYIGLTDIQNESRFIWEDGNDATFTSWMFPEVTTSGYGNGDCTILLRDSGQWIDMPCTDDYAFVCEKFKE